MITCQGGEGWVVQVSNRRCLLTLFVCLAFDLIKKTFKGQTDTLSASYVVIILPIWLFKNKTKYERRLYYMSIYIQYSSGGFSKSPPNRWGWFFSPPQIFLIPHSNSHRDGFFAHRVSAEFPPQNHPLTCRTPRWAKVNPSELAMKD